MISNLDIEKYHEINMDQVFVALADRNIRVNKCTCPCNCNSDDVATVKARNKCRCKCDCDESGAQPWHKNNKLRNNFEGNDPTAQNKLYAARRRGTLIVSISSSVNRYVVNSIEDTQEVLHLPWLLLSCIVRVQCCRSYGKMMILIPCGTVNSSPSWRRFDCDMFLPA